MAIVALKVSKKIINVASGEAEPSSANEFLFGCAQIILPILVSLILFLIIGFIVIIIKFIIGLS